MPARLDHARLANTPRVSGHRHTAWRLLCGAVWLGCSLGLCVSLGCVSSSLHSESVDVVQNPDLVKQCALRSEGTYTAVGETNALTLARNATVKNGGNVFLLMAVDKSETLTTAVKGKIYACQR
ncbi:MAG: hypothetical protein AB7N91_10530 [Candidatus Tectimicrobiota bacterium]